MRNIFAVLIFILFFGLGTAFSCDVSIVSVISGTNPRDTFSKSLLEMSVILIEVGRDIISNNKVAAEEKTNRALKSWMAFDNSYSRNPPGKITDIEKWTIRCKEFADALGKLKENVEGGKLPQAHDSLEGMVSRLNLLSCLPEGNSLRVNLGEAELALMELKPDGSIPDQKDFAIRFGNFRSLFEKAQKIAVASSSVASLPILIGRVEESSKEFEKLIKGPPPPLVVSQTAFNKLRDFYSDMKKSLVK
ncbi:MAG: hypothetical protein HQM08_13780 [Candidatus Riflebacteria bacterium]|nr:hypothetical protein [Candidatus Riflebacteria bacterium]